MTVSVFVSVSAGVLVFSLAAVRPRTAVIPS